MEKLNLGNIISKLGIVFFVIFIYSGLIKWIKIWPVDPTPLFGGLAVLLLICSLILKEKVSITRKELSLASIFIIFSIWLYVSFTYSISSGYSYTKATNYVLIMITFISPFFLLKAKKDLKFLLINIAAIGIVISLVLYYLYIMGGMNLYTLYFHAMEGGNKQGIPDYLALGAPVGLSSIILFFSRGRVSKALSLVTISALILLAGRGPILALVLIGTIYCMFRFKLTKSSLIALFVVPILLILGAGNITKWKGADRLISRVELAGNGDKSLSDRIHQLKEAGDLIVEHPILGIGLGSFGLYVFNKDFRSYPHNMLVEIFVEQGIVGFLLILLLLSSVFFWAWRPNFFSKNHLVAITALCLLFEFINILKSSSIIDNRVFFMFLAIVIASNKFVEVNQLSLLNKNSTQ